MTTVMMPQLDMTYILKRRNYRQWLLHFVHRNAGRPGGPVWADNDLTQKRNLKY
jgi:hypothetical protein